MNYLLAIATGLMISGSALSQQALDSLPAKPDGLIFYMPDVICVDDFSSFIQWAQIPEHFSFRLYNRWGQLVFECDKPDFRFEDFLTDLNGAKQPAGLYFCIMTLCLPGEEERTITTNLSYLAWYCHCG